MKCQTMYVVSQLTLVCLTNPKSVGVFRSGSHRVAGFAIVKSVAPDASVG